LRRILLSSIEGAAVTSIKVAKLKHEYSTIPGVYDDILRIILRLKQLALRCFSDEPQIIELNVKGKRVVKAKDIKLTSEVEIANTDLVLTEITDSKGILNIQMWVEKGAGYIPSDEGKRSQIGVIPIDANFSPVKKVIFNIEKTRVGQQIDLDQICFEITTNGAISPNEAIKQSCAIYYTMIKRLVTTVKGEEIEEPEENIVNKTDKEEASSSDLDIDSLNLSVRLTNSLLKAGYKNLTELEGKSVEDFMSIRGLGKRSAEELIEIMKSYKLKVNE
jgi:DNA-directed RNA polymerase subunit alpha